MVRPGGSFRDAMRRMAATVTVVSTRTGGRRHGVTATSVTSLSMEPPALLVCLNRAGSLHGHLAESERFCVNLLRSGQEGVAAAFSGELSSEERFTRGVWREDEGGTPYLADGQASIFCRRRDVIGYGSHSIFIGEVESVLMAEEVSPLIYGDGVYGRLSPAAPTA